MHSPSLSYKHSHLLIHNQLFVTPTLTGLKSTLVPLLYTSLSAVYPDTDSLRLSYKHSHLLKGHSHAILVHFKNQKYVLTSMNAHK